MPVTFIAPIWQKLWGRDKTQTLKNKHGISVFCIGAVIMSAKQFWMSGAAHYTHVSWWDISNFGTASANALHTLTHNMLAAASLSGKIRYNFITVNTYGSSVSNNEGLIFTLRPSNGGSWSPVRHLFPVVLLHRGRSVFTAQMNRTKVSLEAEPDRLNKLVFTKSPNQPRKQTLIRLKRTKCVRCE